MWLFATIIVFGARNLVYAQLFESELCPLDDNGLIGTCTNLHDCPYGIDLLKSRIRPKHCSFNRSIPIVCCSKSNNNLQKRDVQKYRIATEKCAEYSNLYHPQNESASTDANAQDVPHMALLGYGEENDIKWKCSGSLVSEKFVLTSARCINAPRDIVKYVNLGDTRIGAMSSLTSFQKFKVKTIFFYPEYSIRRRYHNIALIELDGKANLQEKVKPACLHSVKDLPDGVLSVSDWHSVYDRQNSELEISVVDVVTVSFETCNVAYKSQTILEGGIVDDRQICAFREDDSRNICKDFPGTPMQIKLEGQPLYTIVGIASFHLTCDSVPRIFSRISYYVPWIEKIVWPQ